MKSLIFLSALLLLSVSAYAEEPEVYTDQDLGKYKSSGKNYIPDNLKHQTFIEDTKEYKDAQREERYRKQQIDDNAQQRAREELEDRRYRSEQHDREARQEQRELERRHW